MSCCTANVGYGNYTVSIRRGDCFDLEVIYKAADVPVDLTGMGAEFSVAVPRPKTSLCPLVVTTDDGGIDPLGSNGRIVVHLTAAQTKAIRTASLNQPSYQLRLIAPDGRRDTLLAGSVNLLANYFEA